MRTCVFYHEYRERDLQVKGGIDPSLDPVKTHSFKQPGQIPLALPLPLWTFLRMGEQLCLATSPMCVTLPRQREESNSEILEETVGSLRSPLYSKASGKKKKTLKPLVISFFLFPTCPLQVKRLRSQIRRAQCSSQGRG